MDRRAPPIEPFPTCCAFLVLATRFRYFDASITAGLIPDSGQQLGIDDTTLHFSRITHETPPTQTAFPGHEGASNRGTISIRVGDGAFIH